MMGARSERGLTEDEVITGAVGVYAARKTEDPLGSFFMAAAREYKQAMYGEYLETMPLIQFGDAISPLLEHETCASYKEQWKTFCREFDLETARILHWLDWRKGYLILLHAAYSLHLTEHSQLVSKPLSDEDQVRDLDEVLDPLKQMFMRGRITAVIGNMGDGKTNLMVKIIRELLTRYPDEYMVVSNIDFKEKMRQAFPQLRKGVFIDEMIMGYREAYAEFIQTNKMKTVLWVMDEFGSAAGKHRGRTVQSINLIPIIQQSRKLGVAIVIIVQWASDIADKFRQTRTLRAQIVTGGKMVVRQRKDGTTYEDYEPITDIKNRHKHVEFWTLGEDSKYRKLTLPLKTTSQEEYYHHDDPTTVDFTRINFREFLKSVTGKHGQARLDAIDKFLERAPKETVGTISPEKWEELDGEDLVHLLWKTPKRILKQHIGQRLQARAWDDDEVEYLRSFEDRTTDRPAFSYKVIAVLYGVTDTTVRRKIEEYTKGKKLDKEMGMADEEEEG